MGIVGVAMGVGAGDLSPLQMQPGDRLAVVAIPKVRLYVCLRAQYHKPPSQREQSLFNSKEREETVGCKGMHESPR